jgi:cysteine protease ATG4
MESAINSVDLGARRIVQMFWDPEPVNDRSAGQPVWCLGHSYQHTHDAKGDDQVGAASNAEHSVSSAQKTPPEAPDALAGKAIPIPPVNAPETPPESFSSSFSSSLAYGEHEEQQQQQQQQNIENGWPQGFLDDFSSRFWMTYRSEFETIAKSSDPKAASSLSFAMRMRSQFGADQSGFSSDSGWGCMIRSGQSLLANTLAMVQLGRGMKLKLSSLCDIHWVAYL